MGDAQETMSLINDGFTFDACGPDFGLLTRLQMHYFALYAKALNRETDGISSELLNEVTATQTIVQRTE